MQVFLLGIIALFLSGCSVLTIESEPVDTSCISGNCTNGYGTKKLTGGALYTGNFSNGKRNGPGVISFTGGEDISGIWINNTLNGGCKRHKGSGPWVSGFCKDTANAIHFEIDEREQKLQQSRERAKQLLERIRAM